MTVVEGADLADEALAEGILAARDPRLVRLLWLWWLVSVGSGGASPLDPVARLRGLRWRLLRLRRWERVGDQGLVMGIATGMEIKEEEGQPV
jgi:hypothetical protein